MSLYLFAGLAAIIVPIVYAVLAMEIQSVRSKRAEESFSTPTTLIQ